MAHIEVLETLSLTVGAGASNGLEFQLHDLIFYQGVLFYPC